MRKIILIMVLSGVALLCHGSLKRAAVKVEDDATQMVADIVIPTAQTVNAEAKFQQKKTELLYKLLTEGKTYDPKLAVWIRSCIRGIDDKNFADWDRLCDEGDKFEADGAADMLPRLLYAVCLINTGRVDQGRDLLMPLVYQNDLSDVLRMVAAGNAVWLEKNRGECYSIGRIGCSALISSLKRNVWSDGIGPQVLFRLLDNYKFPDGWKTVIRNSRDPWLRGMAIGMNEIGEAWKARGKGWAKTVTPNGWAGFEKHLKAACRSLTAAWERCPDRPEAAAEMIIVTMGGHGVEGVSKADWFNRAVKAQLDYEPAYDNLMWALHPRWSGSHAAMLLFGCKALETNRFDTIVPQYFYRALLGVSGEQEHFAWQRPFRVDPVVMKKIDILFGQLEKHNNPKRDEWRARHAILMLGCGDWEKADAILKSVPKNVEFDGLFPKLWVHNLDHLNRSRADWEYLISVYRGPTGSLVERAENYNLQDDGERMAVSMLLAVKENSDPRFREWAGDCLAAMISDEESDVISLKMTGMCRAAEDGNEKLFKLLLKFSCDVNRQSLSGRTPLVCAAQNGENVNIMKQLLQHHANPNIVSKSGLTPLMKAAEMGNIEMCRMLLENGADVNAKDDEGWTAAIFLLRYSRNPDILRLLLDHNALVKTPNIHGWTPLIFAAKFSKNSVFAEMLLEHGADVNSLNHEKQNALMMACDNNAYDVVKLLIEKGADVKMVSSREGNALHHCVDRNDNPELVKLLISSGCGLNDRGKDGNMPLHLAISSKRMESAKVLVENGADINARGMVTLTPLDLAVQYVTPDFAEYLIKRGADVKLRDGDGWGVIYRSAYLNRIDMAKILLAHGADINVKDNAGKTALDIAQNEEMKKFLLAHGAKSGSQLP